MSSIIIVIIITVIIIVIVIIIVTIKIVVIIILVNIITTVYYHRCCFLYYHCYYYDNSLPVLSLQELCCRTITAHTTIYGVDHLPLPSSLKSHLRSYLLDNRTHTTRMPSCHRSGDKHSRRKIIHPSDSPTNCRSPCSIS